MTVGAIGSIEIHNVQFPRTGAGGRGKGGSEPPTVLEFVGPERGQSRPRQGSGALNLNVGLMPNAQTSPLAWNAFLQRVHPGLKRLQGAFEMGGAA